MRPTRKMPLFIVSGASGVGKSAACEWLFHREKDYIVLESDIWWTERFNTPNDNYREYRDRWMRLCASVSQIGLPCVLCGCATPEQFEGLDARELFSEIHYLAVVCDDAALEDRLRRGRGVDDEAWIASSLDFNRWLRAHAARTSPAMALVDNTALPAGETALRIDAWIRERLRPGAAH